METSTEFRGTSAFTGNGCDRTQSTRKEMTCLLRKLYVHTKSDRENQNVNSLGRNPSCQTRSKTLEMLSETRCVSPWLLSEADQECETKTSRLSVGWRDRKSHLGVAQ